jgi:UDP-2,4-diacetamido-2,4,6-trideoxy-beta-L-altropyranose hydrolase
MLAVFRVDSSHQIGIGHVMRCLTLAQSLTGQGVLCHFICRDHSGNLIKEILQRGYTVHSLKMQCDEYKYPIYSDWLGATQVIDAEESSHIISQLNADFVVVDHYAIGAEWTKIIASICRNIMVIDDLADRQHFCQTLLDQTFKRSENDYHDLVPSECKLFCGSMYALLDSSFVKMRPQSLARRVDLKLERILINFGGVDRLNFTQKILTALQKTSMPPRCEIDVVMGYTAPAVDAIKSLAAHMQRPTRVHVGVNNMAKLMAVSDLAIGAAGATSWERCCLGLPSVMVVSAENQRLIADSLSDAGAAITTGIEDVTDAVNFLFREENRGKLYQLSAASSLICDGLGVARITQHILKSSFYEN